nr:Ig-like domain repeat protein [Paenibacillus turpanensis]
MSSFSAFPGKANAFSGGKGTEAEPFIITTADQLKSIANNLSGYFKLGRNIDLKYVTWVPLGNSNYPFKGGFDGNGYTITGLTISRAQYNHVGLFGYVTDGYIRNVNLTDVNVAGKDDTGSLVGYTMKSVIQNVHASGVVKGEDQVGGLVGFLERNATITGSSANVNVEGLLHIGGLIGRYGSFTSMDANYATGNVLGESNVGGLIGWLEGNGGVHDSYATGVVTGGIDVGGLIGYNGAGPIEYTYASGDVHGRGAGIGGLIGQNDIGTVSKSYATGNVSVKDGSYVIAGGFIGRQSTGRIDNSYATGSVMYEGPATSTFLAGFVPSSSGPIVNAYSAGKVVGPGDSVGGFSSFAGDMTSTYYDTEVSEKSDTGKGTPKTTIEMQTMSTFINWDFDTIWSIKEGQEYPKLRPYIRKYSVTYDGNNRTIGQPPTDSNPYPEGSSVTVLGNTGELKRNNYAFAGWNTKADGTGTTYQEGDTFTIGAGHFKLYAKWEELTHISPALITTQPADYIVGLNDSVTMSVYATGSGTLSYEWYQASDLNRTAGDILLQGQTSNSIVVDTSELGEKYYFVLITHYDPTKTGMNTTTSPSRVAKVTVVSKAATTTTVASSVNPSIEGQQVTFTATVTNTLPGTPTGTVTFKAGNTTLGTASLTVGEATYSTNSLSLGTHQITAVYNGDGTFSPSTSTTVSQTVNDISSAPKKPTATTVLSNQNPSTAGQNVMFTAIVSGTDGTPTGSVTFKNGNTILGTVDLTVGTATYQTNQLPIGLQLITVDYSGDSQFNVSSSAKLEQMVTEASATQPTPPSSPGRDSDEDEEPPAPSAPSVPYVPATPATPAAPEQPTTPSTPAVPERMEEYQDPNDIFRSRVVNADSNVISGVQNRTTEILRNGMVKPPIQYDDVDQHWSLPSVEKLTKLGVLNGYPEGGFEPDEQITRAEFAAMIDRGFVDMASRNVTLNEEELAAFHDINDHWATNNLKKLVAVGVLTGYEDGTIRPEKTITRQEMAIMITRVLNAYILNKDTSNVQFTDLDQAFGADAIKKATVLGIFTGKTTQAFDPNGGATRAESIQTIINTYSLSPTIKEALQSLN